MRLTVLGCAGTFPSATSGCSAYLFEHEGFTLLVDAGNGAIGALQRHAGLLDVDAVLLSHLHADHCLDLIAYSYARRYHPEHPPRLPVYGPAGTRDRLVNVFDRPPSDRLGDVYDFRRTTPGTVQVGPFEVTLTRTAHPIECHAVGVRAGGRSVVYSADTGETPALVDAARDADLFLCESTWLEDGAEPRPPALHLTARQAAEHAKRAGVGELALIHTTSYLDPQRYLDEAGEVWDGPLTLARPDLSFDF